ncbi:MAG: triose-phosphate isomerase [Candidatus Eremiobacteraeota bacterium]|nr:triose-phosphate isomerase [Candidatus Eremiobacteraeota bacterium]
MSARRPLIAGNWKMHKTIAETRTLLAELCELAMPNGVDVMVAPPFTALAAARDRLRDCGIGLGAQTMSEHEHGPYTGDISPVMLRELSVRWVILGHSERRAYFNETDDGVARKVRAALAHGMTPIVAVGETADEHQRGETIAKVTFQARAAFAGLTEEEVRKCVVAYEPIWAIGTGLVDEPASANGVIGEIRGAVEGLEYARVLYGGSMKGDNATALMAEPNIDGGLIGGASLSVQSFMEIVAAAALRAAAPR